MYQEGESDEVNWLDLGKDDCVCRGQCVVRERSIL